MDDLTFDRLARLVSTDASRRTVVRSAGASALGALGLAALLDSEEAPAKKGGKKKKRRCRRFNASCNPNGKNCCQGLKCEEGACCKKLGTKCTDGSECCGTGICDNVTPGSQHTICCNLEGNFCSKERDCCDGFTCNEQTNECEPES